MSDASFNAGVDKENYNNTLNRFYADSDDLLKKRDVTQHGIDTKIADRNTVTNAIVGAVALPIASHSIGNTIKGFKEYYENKAKQVANQASEKYKEWKDKAIGDENEGTGVTEESLLPGEPNELGDYPMADMTGNLNFLKDRQTPWGQRGDDDDISNFENSTVDEFNPANIPEGAGGRVQLGKDTTDWNNYEPNTTIEGDESETAFSAPESSVPSETSDVAKTAESVGESAVEDIAEDEAVGSAFGPVGDAIGGLVAVGSIIATALSRKKPKSAPAPPPLPNPSVSFGL